MPGTEDRVETEDSRQLTVAKEKWKNFFSQKTKFDKPESRSSSRPFRQLTRVNQRENKPWGGDRDCTRLYLQNLNGIRMDRQEGQFNHVCAVINKVQAIMFGGQEHKFNSIGY